MLGVLSLLLACNIEMQRDKDSKIIVDVQKVASYQKRGLRKSYESAVKIVTFSEEGIGSGSGNYFIYNRKKFILTAAHIVDGAEHVQVQEKFGIGSSKCRVVYTDERYDLAVLALEEDLKTIKPISYVDNNRMSRGEKVFFTGYPSQLEDITSIGMVAGEYAGYYVLQSMAWLGSSGSVVFNQKGQVVGVVSAIKVGWTSVGIPQLIDNMVLVSPISVLEKSKLREVLENGGI